MVELRKEPLTGNWVIISTERGKRPLEFTGEETIKKGGEKCPFCEGNESLTPPEIFSYRKKGTKPDTPGWWIRVVPNKYPALQSEGGLNKRKKGIYEVMNGIGAHEVIIEAPQHVEDIFFLGKKVIEKVIRAYRERMIDLMRDSRFKYILIFKNKGRAAGASLNHSHSQLIATPIVPKCVEEELKAARRYFDFKKSCIFCDIIGQEKNLKERVLWEDENFLSFCPFASRFPYEMWILPKRHSSDFEEINQSEIESLAGILKKCISSLTRISPHLPYNYVIHTSPCDRPDSKYYHWHLEIIPRLTVVAGFEWGAGFYINYIPPEKAARELKQKG